MQLRNTNLNYYAITLGASLPFKRSYLVHLGMGTWQARYENEGFEYAPSYTDQGNILIRDSIHIVNKKGEQLNT